MDWVITVEDWAEIRRLHAREQMSIRAIAKRLGIARDTVSRAVAAQRPPRYERPPVVSRFDATRDGPATHGPCISSDDGPLRAAV